ncbi:MAG: hypothetical protein J6V31_01400, partial [Tidjanibacter sp.]|nr:hypothetical protein [Tidjanibacter sp.]
FRQKFLVPLFPKSGEEKGCQSNVEIRSISPKVFGSAFSKKRRRKRLSVERRNTQYFVKSFWFRFLQKAEKKKKEFRFLQKVENKIKFNIV